MRKTSTRFSVPAALSVAAAVTFTPVLLAPAGSAAVAAPTSAAATASAAVRTVDAPLTRAEKRAIKAENTRNRLVKVAKAKKRSGAQYVAGASSATRFDCSGFTKYLYKSVANKYLPHYSGAQMRKGQRVSRNNLKKGDLLFWGPGGSQHVSMYIGKGKMIGANNPRSDIQVESINAPWWRNKYAGATRIIKG